MLLNCNPSLLETNKSANHSSLKICAKAARSLSTNLTEVKAKFGPDQRGSKQL